MVDDKHLESGEGWERYESGYYFSDENHSGRIYVSQKMVEKYNLNEQELDDKWFEDKVFFCDEDEDTIEWLKELQQKYAQEIYLSHCACYSKEGSSDEDYRKAEQETPHGDCWMDDSFVAWWNDFAPELLNEKEEDVYVHSWRDG